MDKKIEDKNKNEENNFKEDVNNFQEEIQNKLSSLCKEVINNKDENVKNDKKKIVKIMKLVEMFSAMKMLKEDTKPIELINNLFIGSIGAASNLKILEENKITHILIVGQGIKKYFPDKFHYMTINVVDTENENIKKYFNETGEFINNAIVNNGKVFVHCHAGISRSGTICIAYIMKYKKIKFEDALNLVREKRKKISPNKGFINQLKEYEKELNI